MIHLNSDGSSFFTDEPFKKLQKNVRRVGYLNFPRLGFRRSYVGEMDFKNSI